MILTEGPPDQTGGPVFLPVETGRSRPLPLKCGLTICLIDCCGVMKRIGVLNPARAVKAAEEGPFRVDVFSGGMASAKSIAQLLLERYHYYAVHTGPDKGPPPVLNDSRGGGWIFIGSRTNA
jgi:hypothetical protein